MKAVFVGGSRRVSRLNDEIRRRLNAMIQGRLWVYIGDANGADKAVQQFFADQQYERVIVYCVNGRHRNNIGHWPTRPVEPPTRARGFDYYAAKDIQMAADASFGMMLWDGTSRGTLANIRNLLAHGKPVAVYLRPRHQFRDLKRETDLAELLSSTRGHGGPAGTGGGSPQRELTLRTHRPQEPQERNHSIGTNQFGRATRAISRPHSTTSE